MPCAPWFGIHAVSRPSSPQTAAAALVSIGAGATRWLMIVWLTTTSQPSNRSGVERGGIAPVAGHVRACLLEQQAGVVRLIAERGGQLVVVDRHQLDRILALVRMLGDHGGDWLADVPDLVGGQQPL